VLFPFDPLLRWRLGGCRVTVRVGTLLVLAVVAGGIGTHRNDILASAAPIAAWLVASSSHAALGIQTARRLGVPIERCEVALFGATVVQRPPSGPARTETTIGAVGLAWLLALTAPAMLARLVLDPAGAWGAALDPAVATVGCLTVTQAMPGWPLDGGRLFAAFVAAVTGDDATGFRAAVVYARLIAVVAAAGGLLLLPAANEAPFWGLWLTAGAVQLGSAAEAARRRATWERLGRSVALGDLATPLAIPIRSDAIIDDALDRVLAAGPEMPLLVVDGANRPIGVLLLANLRAASRSTWDTATIGDVATPLATLPRLNATMPVPEALARLDDLGAEIGLIERENAVVAAVSRRQLLGRPVSRTGT